MSDTQIRGPGRPRESHVPTEAGRCEKHGPVRFRLHRSGKNADGTQRFLARCPQCHNERNQGYAK